MFWLQLQYAVLNLQTLNTRGAFLEGRSGPFSNVACVLRATTKKVVNFFAFFFAFFFFHFFLHLLFVNLPTNFFPSDVTPPEGVTRGGLPYPASLVTPLYTV